MANRAELFSDATVGALAAEIDRQLADLNQGPDVSLVRGLTETGAPLARQVAVIEEITQEPPMSFLKKFRLAAKADICEEGGVLHAQWQKWQDLVSGDVVKQFGPILVAMGFSGTLLESLVVALAVIVIHIGLKAFCEEFGE